MNNRVTIVAACRIMSADDGNHEVTAVEPNQTPGQRLSALRIIWGALLIGQIIYLLITLSISKTMSPPPVGQPQLFLYIAVGMLAVLVPTGFALRAAIYRQGRRPGGLIAPANYATGNIIFWAMCEGVGFAAITFGLINRAEGGHLFVAVIAMAILLANFPSGGAMRRN